jgi:hypothetical protein
MARLPQPGSDNGTWGDILNDFLSQALKSNGLIKDNAVTANTLAPGSVTNAAIASDAVNAASIADGVITEPLLSTAVQTKLNAAGTPDWNTITNKPAVIAAGADQASARTAIGAGTSNLVIGTSNTTAKAGDYAPTKSDVGLGNVDNTSDANKPISTATQTALSGKAATSHTHTASQISDSTATGRSVLVAADAAAARTAIGAGTSNLAIGASSTTAKAGDYQPTAANISDSTAIGRSVLTTASQSAALSALGAAASGTIKTGVKGGTAAVIRRRDLPHRSDQAWSTSVDGTVTETVTTNATATTITSAAAFGLINARLTALGGETLHTDGSSGSSYKFDWKYNDAGGYPAVNSYPNPKGWSVQFSLYGASEIEFLVYARTGAAWNLMIDGKKVWDIPRTTALTLNSHNLIKFALPDSGMHTFRFYMNNLSLRTVFATTGTTPFAVQPRGPRVFFLGDSLTQGGGQATGVDLGSWVWRFSEMCGFEDVWNGGVGSTGPIATNGGNSANYQTRATTDVVPASPDVIFITSYYNDRTQLASDVATAIGTTIDNIRAGMTGKDPMIIVTGSWDPLGVNGSPYTTVDAAILPVCTARGVPFIEPRTGAIYDGSGTQIMPNGGGGVWITSSNQAGFVGGDNVHYNDAGSKYLAYRMYNAFRALLPA